MWRKRTASFGGILNSGRRQNFVAKVPAQIARLAQVHPAATKQRRKLAFQGGHAKVTDVLTWPELDEHIHIA
jgi:hypothetical protein